MLNDEEIDAWLDKVENWSSYSNDEMTMFRQLCAQAKSPAAGGAEAVAWALIRDDGKILEYRQLAPGEDVRRYMRDHNNAQWTPLYAHSSVAGMPSEPTDEMIEAGMAASGMGYEWTKRVCKAMLGVRAIGGA